jgi:hypothetical protein
MKNLILSISFFVTVTLIPSLAPAVSVTFTDQSGAFLPVPGTDSRPGSQGIATFTGPFGQFIFNSFTVTADQGELVDLLVLTGTSITANQPGALQISFSDPFDRGEGGSRPGGTYPAGYLIFGNFTQSRGDVAYIGIFARQFIDSAFAASQVNFFLGGPNVDNIPCGAEEFPCDSLQSGNLFLNFAAAGDTVEIFGSIRQAVALTRCIGSDCSAGTTDVLNAIRGVPEPSALILFAIGLASIRCVLRKRRPLFHRNPTRAALVQ